MDNEEQSTEREQFQKTRVSSEYQDLRLTGDKHDPPSNIFYKGMSIYNADKIFMEGIIGEFYLRHNNRIVYITKDKSTAEKYAEEKNGVVVVIDGNKLNIEPSGHSNQFIVQDYVPRENIVNIYRVESVKDNPVRGKGYESWEEQQKKRELRERREGEQQRLGGY